MAVRRDPLDKSTFAITSINNNERIIIFQGDVYI